MTKPARPRLALLHYTAMPVLGGVEAIVESHRRLLTDAGYAVRVVAGRGDCDLLPELDSRHPEVEAVTKCLAAADFPRERFDALQASITAALDEALREVDLVIAHNVLTMPFNLPLAAALGARRPVLAWTHDLAWTNPRYVQFQRTGPPYDLLQVPAPGARYVAISKPVQAQLLSTYGVLAEVVPNGIDRTAVLRIRPQTQELLRRSGVLDADPLVFVPFRVTRRKRLELALEAVERLSRSMPRLKLVVSGPLGPHSGDNDGYWRSLESLRRELGLADRAVFLHELGDPHPVDDEMVAELYQLASVVLLTSESEGFGLPVLEAGLARVPVVCTDLDVFREVAQGLVWTFPLEASPDAVAAVLDEALAGRSAQLQRKVVANYDWQRILPQLEREIKLAVA